jgi:hypothetical protein
MSEFLNSCICLLYAHYITLLFIFYILYCSSLLIWAWMCFHKNIALYMLSMSSRHHVISDMHFLLRKNIVRWLPLKIYLSFCEFFGHSTSHKMVRILKINQKSKMPVNSFCFYLKILCRNNTSRLKEWLWIYNQVQSSLLEVKQQTDCTWLYIQSHSFNLEVLLRHRILR